MKSVGIFTLNLWLPNSHDTSGYWIAYILSSSCLFVALMGKLILSFKKVLRTVGRSKAHYCKTVLILACYSRETSDADEKEWIWWPGDHSIWAPVLRAWRASSAQVWQLKEATAFIENEGLTSWKLMGWTPSLVMALPFGGLLGIFKGFTEWASCTIVLANSETLDWTAKLCRESEEERCWSIFFCFG